MPEPSLDRARLSIHGGHHSCALRKTGTEARKPGPACIRGERGGKREQGDRCIMLRTEEEGYRQPLSAGWRHDNAMNRGPQIAIRGKLQKFAMLTTKLFWSGLALIQFPSCASISSPSSASCNFAWLNRCRRLAKDFAVI